MPGGILFESDWDRLKDSVIRACKRFPDRDLRFIEIGVNDGRTSRDLIDAISSRTTRFSYTGIDPAPGPASMPPAYRHIQALSHNAINSTWHHTDRVHWVLVDGCHCSQCVIRDAILYGNLLACGGELLFHDASPGMQGRDPQDYASMRGYHDEAEARKGIAVRKVLDASLLGGFELIQAAPDQAYGGVEIYRKL